MFSSYLIECYITYYYKNKLILFDNLIFWQNPNQAAYANFFFFSIHLAFFFWFTIHLAFIN